MSGAAAAGGVRGRGPIGVFDSGVGGLTVLRALRRALPDEQFVYLGDTARLPYGTKSPETVIRYSLQCAEVLAARGIRCLVVACNTASASALAALRERYAHIPVIGVVEPGAAAAVETSRSGHIVVIATEGCVAGGAYQAAIRRLSSRAQVSARACGLFVAMAEEGWTEGPIAAAVAQRYLAPLFSAQAGGGVGGPDAAQAAEGPAGPADTLVLGCTHFPLLAGVIEAAIPAHVRIVDSAATTALAVVRELGREGHEGRGGGQGMRDAGDVDPTGGIRWLATDDAARFARVGSRFFGTALHAGVIEIVDL